jgi:UDP-N-acetylglucosamine 2-epimerase (non-hydrolysing)
MTFARVLSLLGGIELLNLHGEKTILLLSSALKGALDRFELWSWVERIKQLGGLVQEPWLSYRSVVEFLRSENCKAIYTDSGGLQEEATILGTRCFTCRFNTDRPETVLDFGSNLLIPPSSPEMIAFGVMSNLEGRSQGLQQAVRETTEKYGKDVGQQIALALEQLPAKEALAGATAAFRAGASVRL